ncbi:uncharacterized protein LOC127750630 [Frankliniella occidentalis]|uniref:Uncharacterized protein LOC127750630 n=1 Tax=Frankliniella occidentalis TaxID=133901 RepID=A0A9C6XRW3_FRAOC|nr:uncharacterized protein LOC127750630 [Frankliniella occidentalis]
MSELENVKKELRTRIVEILGSIEDEIIEQLIERFVELGVEKMRDIEDVARVKPEQLQPIIKYRKASKLIEHITKSFEENRGGESSTQGPYTHDWSIYPPDIMNRLNKGKPLSGEQMRELKKRTIRHLKYAYPNFGRKFLKVVGEAMLKKYSVLESTMGKDNKIQTKTLGFSLVTHLDNRNRNPTPRTTEEIEAPAIPEAYGCVKWQVANLPEGETEESLEEKRKKLLDIFENTDHKSWNWDGETLPLLEATHSMQRKDINTQSDAHKKTSRKRKRNEDPAPPEPAKTTDGIIEDWPLLFSTRGLNFHIKILTGVPLIEKFADFLTDDEFSSLIDFLATRKQQDKEENHKVKAAMDQAIKRGTNKHDASLLALVKMLTFALGEKDRGVVRVIEESVDMDEIEEVQDIPGPPVCFRYSNHVHSSNRYYINLKQVCSNILTVAGQTAFRAKKFFICLDGKARMCVRRFSSAITSMFALYFVINIQYSSDAPSTLDFIQRNILDINPPSGSKLPRSLRGKGPVQRCLSRLKEQLDRFRANNEDSSNSSVDEPDLEAEESES